MTHALHPPSYPRRTLLKYACGAASWWAAPQVSMAHVLDAPECIAPAKIGGGFDLTCKLVGEIVSGAHPAGKPLRISYLPGGIGAVAYDRVVTQRLHNPQALVAFSSGSLLNLVQGKFGRHDASDVRWVAALGMDYGAIAVHKNSPIQTVRDLFQQLQQDFSRVVFGAGGTVGSQDWVKAALLVRAAGRDHKAMRFVSFEGGGEALAALEGKHVSVFCGDAAEALQSVDAGAQIRVVAILSEKRLPGARAHLPTAVEQGLNLVWPVVRGVYVGRNVSDDDYNQWVEVFQAAARAPGYEAMRTRHRLDASHLSGKALDAFVHQQTVAYQVLARQLGLRVSGTDPQKK